MNDFGRLLEPEIPRLRRYARALTRDPARADDLVQDCLIRAIAKQHLWQAGTDLRAWLFTILHNQYVNYVRRSVRDGAHVDIDDLETVLAVECRAPYALQLRDLRVAMAKLADEQRQAVLLVGLEAMSYEDVASVMGIPLGTVRSRLSRGRENLRRLMGLRDAPDPTSVSEAEPAAFEPGEVYPIRCRASTASESSDTSTAAFRSSGSPAGGLPSTGPRSPAAPRPPRIESAD